MENNLDDVLIDNFEEKPQKKNKKRIILIVASVVLLGVLGISSLMLAKQDTKPKNPEFSELEVELEKLVPPSESPKPAKQEDEFDKLIADIKSRHAQEEIKPHITPAQDAKKTQESKPTPQPQAPIAKKEETKPKDTKISEHKIDLNLEDLAPIEPKEEKKSVASPMPNTQAQKPVPKPEVKANEKKSQSLKEKKPTTQATTNKSASQLFQSVERSTPKGYYLQVGVFGGTPQKSFLDKLKNHSYKTDKIQRSGKVLTRYLIGPFPSKEMAQSKIEQITHEINKPVIIEIR